MKRAPGIVATASLAALGLAVPACALAATSADGRSEIKILRTAIYKDTADEGAGSMMVRSAVRYRHAVPAARTGTWFAVTETTLRGPGGTTVVRDADVVTRITSGEAVDHRVVVDPVEVDRLEGPGQDPSTLRATTRSWLVQSRFASNEVRSAPRAPMARETVLSDVVPTSAFPRVAVAYRGTGGRGTVECTLTVWAGWSAPFGPYVQSFELVRKRDDPVDESLVITPAAYRVGEANPSVSPDGVFQFVGRSMEVDASGNSAAVAGARLAGQLEMAGIDTLSSSRVATVAWGYRPTGTWPAASGSTMIERVWK